MMAQLKELGYLDDSNKLSKSKVKFILGLCNSDYSKN